MRGRMKGKATRGNVVSHGEFGLQALEPAWITSRQIEAARIAMTRYTKRGGQVWIKIFPDKPVTRKPAESEEVAREAMRLAMHKLPIKCKFVKRQAEDGE